MEAAARDTQTPSPILKPENNPTLSKKSQRQKGKKTNISWFLKILFSDLYQKAKRAAARSLSPVSVHFLLTGAWGKLPSWLTCKTEVITLPTTQFYPSGITALCHPILSRSVGLNFKASWYKWFNHSSLSLGSNSMFETQGILSFSSVKDWGILFALSDKPLTHWPFLMSQKNNQCL